jgi:hypothetical protein
LTVLQLLVVGLRVASGGFSSTDSARHAERQLVTHLKHATPLPERDTTTARQINRVQHRWSVENGEEGLDCSIGDKNQIQWVMNAGRGTRDVRETLEFLMRKTSSEVQPESAVLTPASIPVSSSTISRIGTTAGDANAGAR